MAAKKKTGKGAVDAAPASIEDDHFKARLVAAMAETEQLLRSGSRVDSDPTLPVFQVAAQETIERHRLSYVDGDKSALLDAIRKCLVHGLVAPDWIVVEFVHQHGRVVACEVASWDDVFGKPFPKGTHLTAQRKRRNLAPYVFNEVRRRSAMGEPISEALFESVGQALGLGKTVVAEYYYGFSLSGNKRVPGKTEK